MKQLLPFTCALALAACSAESQKEYALPVQTKLVAAVDTLTYISCLDSVEVKRLSRLVKPAHELKTLLARNDTVILVLGNRDLFFPLGKYSYISAAQKAYSAGYTHQVRKQAEIITDEVKKGPDTITFIKTSEEAEVYIIAGSITQPALNLVNGAAVGMSKVDFLREYFSTIPKQLLRGGSVIELVSALDGIKHYYSFRSGRLLSIQFTSDYVAD